MDSDTVKHGLPFLATGAVGYMAYDVPGLVAAVAMTLVLAAIRPRAPLPEAQPPAETPVIEGIHVPSGDRVSYELAQIFDKRTRQCLQVRARCVDCPAYTPQEDIKCFYTTAMLSLKPEGSPVFSQLSRLEGDVAQLRADVQELSRQLRLANMLNAPNTKLLLGILLAVVSVVIMQGVPAAIGYLRLLAGV